MPNYFAPLTRRGVLYLIVDSHINLFGIKTFSNNLSVPLSLTLIQELGIGLGFGIMVYQPL